MSSCYCPPFCIPRVGDRIRGSQDCLIYRVVSGLTTNPTIFLNDSCRGDCGTILPQKVLEVQGTGGDVLGESNRQLVDYLDVLVGRKLTSAVPMETS
jgi:transaldolase